MTDDRSSHAAQVPGDGKHEIIPGERDAGTLTHREPGAIGGRFNGADLPPVPIDAMLDDQTIHDHEIEGGGDAVKHRRDDRHHT